MERENWSETDLRMMRMALAEAERCEQSGDVPVGAVVCRGQEMIAAERNRKEALRDPTAHAEMLAIRKACRLLASPYLQDCTLYVSLEPCAMCAGAIIHARLGRVVFAAPDPKTGALGSLCNIGELDLNHQPEIISGLYREESAQILRSFFRRRRLENKKIGGRGMRRSLIAADPKQSKGVADEEIF